jgi:hypothetical protein
MRNQTTLRTKIRTEGMRVPSNEPAPRAFGGLLPHLLLTGAMALMVGALGGYHFAQHRLVAEHSANVVLATRHEASDDVRKTASSARALESPHPPEQAIGRSPFDAAPSPSSPLPNGFKLPSPPSRAAVAKVQLSNTDDGSKELKPSAATQAKKAPSFLSRSQSALADPPAEPAPSEPSVASSGPSPTAQHVRARQAGSSALPGDPAKSAEGSKVASASSAVQ